MIRAGQAAAGEGCGLEVLDTSGILRRHQAGDDEPHEVGSWLREEMQLNPIDEQVRLRREKLADPSIAVDAPDKWGLALSGGGIRSATFCFGVLRALAHEKVLLRFDLLSTVSGGGYIGTMLGCLFHRAKDGEEARKVQEAIDGQRARTETHPGGEMPTGWFLWWLRANGRYLIPRGAKDTVFAFTLYLRNLIGIHFELGLVAVALGLLLCAVNLVMWWGVEAAGYAYSSRQLFDLLRWLPGWMPTIAVLVPFIMVSAVRLGAAYWSVPLVQGKRALKKTYSVVLGLDVVLCCLFYFYGTTPSEEGDILRNVLWWSIGGLVALSVVGAISAEQFLHDVGNEDVAGLQADTVRNLLTKRLMLRLAAMGFVVVAGLVDRVAWNLAFDGISLVSSGLALAIAAAVLRGLAPLASGLSARGGGSLKALLFLARLAGYGLTFFLTSWWVSLVYRAVLGALFTGQSLSYSDAWQVLGLVALPTLTYMFWTGRNLGFLNQSSLHSFYRARLVRSYMGAANGTRFEKSQPLGALERVQSLMPTGHEGPSIDDVIKDDDLSLKSYCPQRSGGPVHLINVCVNQTSDPRGHLFNQDRRGLPLTVASGGLMKVSQEAWAQLTKATAMSVGRWMSISGAAMAPGMGALTRGGVAALMAFAGVRLGYWWSQEERTGVQPEKGAARLAKSKGLLNELLGNFKGTGGSDWFLTDGGHFENTGAYALLAERAKVIVVADCGADPTYTFGDLENLVRIARIDLQAEIQFLRPLCSDGNDAPAAGSGPKFKAARPVRAEPPQQLSFFGSINDLASPTSTACLALARVTYGGAQPGEGILILIKPNICAGLPVDLMNFKDQYPEFPQQPTADQFFSEAQWESYFLLGQFLGSHLDRDFIQDHLLGNRSAYFENDDRLPFDQADAKASANAGRLTTVPISRLPARLATSAAVGTTLGLGAAATVGVSTWQAIDSVRTAYAKKASDERLALKELTDLWGRVPAKGFTKDAQKDTSIAIAQMAAALVRTADTLCPTDEAGWYVRSPVAARISNDTIARCGDLLPEQRGSACHMLLEGANGRLKSKLPNCLAWEAKRRQSLPPPKYWGYDYSNTMAIDYWHPCDPMRRELFQAEEEHLKKFNVIVDRQTEPQYATTQTNTLPSRCNVPLSELAFEDRPQGSIDMSSTSPEPAASSAAPPASATAPASAPASAASASSASPSSSSTQAPANQATAEQSNMENSVLGRIFGSKPDPVRVSADCRIPDMPVSMNALRNVCEGMTVYVQTYGKDQWPTRKCDQAKWQTWFGARPLNIEDVTQSARQKGRPDPLPVSKTTVRFHDTASQVCAGAIGEAIGGPPRIEPLSARLKPARRTVEVWFAPDPVAAVGGK